MVRYWEEELNSIHKATITAISLGTFLNFGVGQRRIAELWNTIGKSRARHRMGGAM